MSQPPRHLTDRMRPEIVAHHEAAHAVVALELGVGLLEVGIDISRVEETGGIGIDGCRLFVPDLLDAQPETLPAEQARLAGQIDCSGTVLAAGPAADARLLGEDPWTALQHQRSDFRRMRELLHSARLDASESMEQDRLRAQVGLAVEALEDPAVWQAVEAVAQAVLNGGPLAGRDLEAIAEPILNPGDRPRRRTREPL